MTRRQALVLQLNLAHEQLITLKNIMLALKHGPITEAAEHLARLRLGEDVGDLARVKNHRRSICELQNNTLAMDSGA